MSGRYQISVLSNSRDDWLATLKQSVDETLHALGIRDSVVVDVSKGFEPSDAPSIMVVLLGNDKANNEKFSRDVEWATHKGVVVIPIAENLAIFPNIVPNFLSRLNGFGWDEGTAVDELVHLLFAELEIEDRTRGVFISHRRFDGSLAANQVHDSLTRRHFTSFIDQFCIPTGVDFQDAIADALENFAFLLLLETPDAHNSDYVFDEVQYASTHAMGALILQWPDVSVPVPASENLPRLVLTPKDFTSTSPPFTELTSAALTRIVKGVEHFHACAITRRRRAGLRSVQESAENAGAICRPLSGHRLSVATPDQEIVVAVVPRLPDSGTLHRLDELRQESQAVSRGILVHMTPGFSGSRKEHLDWVIHDRALTMVPVTALDAQWH